MPMRITVTNENASGDWRGAILAIESRDHPQDATADTTAALAYDAADLTPKGAATVSGGEIVHSALTEWWLSILGSEIDGVGHMTHIGVRRMWFRIQDTGAAAGDIEVRLRWRALGSSVWTTNRIVPSPLTDDYQLLDLGECRPDRAVLGDQRWEWELQARAPEGSGEIRIQKVYPLPTEQYILVSTPKLPLQPEAQSQRSAGTGADVDVKFGSVTWGTPEKIVSSDGSYATASLPGTVSHQLQATNFGFALPSTAIPTGIIVEVEASRTGDPVGAWLDILPDRSGPGQRSLSDFPTSDTYLQAGSSTDLWGGGASSYPWGAPWTYADINSRSFGVALTAYGKGATSAARVNHIRITVAYTETPDENRVCFATRSMEFRSDGVFRQHPDDDTWGQAAPEGFLPYAPPSGMERRAARFVVVPTQGDFDQLADSGTNRMSATVSYHPAYAFARESESA